MPSQFAKGFLMYKYDGKRVVLPRVKQTLPSLWAGLGTGQNVGAVVGTSWVMGLL